MIEKLYTKNRILFLIIIDTAILVSAYVCSILIRFDFQIPIEWNFFYKWLPLIVISQISIFYITGFYRSIWRFTSLYELFTIMKLMCLSSILTTIVMFFMYAFESYPRSIILIYFLVSSALISLSRILVRVYYSSSYENINKMVIKNNKKKLILIGAGKTGEKIAREIINSKNSLYEIVGFVDDNLDKINRKIHGYSILGNIKSLNNLNINFDEILITAPSASGDQVRKIVFECKNSGKRFRTVPSLNELIDKDFSLDSIRDVSYADLLGRDEIKLDQNSLDNLLNGKRILISGAGGSIGFELVKQCLSFNPSEIICLDINEESIFKIEEYSKYVKNRTIIKPVLANVLELNHLEKIFKENFPQIIFHAAAYKHVPIQETYPWAAVKTNVKGTKNIIELSDKYNADKFVLVSTDKAVNPVNVMGATKRLAEKLVRSKSLNSKCEFSAVRFGNVLGSSGSAIPTFQKQIKKGGPVTITHPEMTRYFMSIPEAAQLILQSAALATSGNIFLLEMGKPIKIDRMARDLIKLSGLEPEIDIPIAYIGLRPGEKLYEELQSLGERKIKTVHKKIMILREEEKSIKWSSMMKSITNLFYNTDLLDRDGIQYELKKLLPTYKPRSFKSQKLEAKTRDPFLIKGQA